MMIPPISLLSVSGKVSPVRPVRAVVTDAVTMIVSDPVQLKPKEERKERRQKKLAPGTAASRASGRVLGALLDLKLGG
jgi:hypothetical protein